MTSEVALMNRMAVALAADSASTVSYFEGGERKSRYFKGANKIFNLCASHPVGLMINGSGTLQKMPWELIVKRYRDARGNKELGRLQDYAKDFFTFLASKELFPADYQKQQLITGVCEVAGHIVFSILRQKDVQLATTVEDRKKLAAKHLKEHVVWLRGLPYISAEAKKLADETEKSFLSEIEKEFSAGNVYDLAKDLLDIKEVLSLASHAFFVPEVTSMGRTGIVVAGYGKSDLFPSLEQYDCFGVLRGTVIYRRADDDCRSINFDVASEIVPIAQDVMAYTFIFGASFESMMAFESHFETQLRLYTAALVDAGELSKSFDTSPQIEEALKNFREQNRVYVHRDASKLRRVIGILPVSELAELAETLVSLESLKERTTRDSESVSGPIDVAVITKGDGFIWIKRKHYFDPTLNLRFVAKKQSEVTE